MENYLKEFLNLNKEIQKQKKDNKKNKVKEWLKTELQMELELKELERMCRIEKAIIRYF